MRVENDGSELKLIEYPYVNIGEVYRLHGYPGGLTQNNDIVFATTTQGRVELYNVRNGCGGYVDKSKAKYELLNARLVIG